MSPRDLVAQAKLRQALELLPPGTEVTLTRELLLDALRVDEAQPQAPLHTVAEVAGQLHRSPSTVRGWCEAGRFAGAFKLNGRDWRIPVAAIARFLAGQRPPAPSKADPVLPTSRKARSRPTDLGAWRKEVAS